MSRCNGTSAEDFMAGNPYNSIQKVPKMPQKEEEEWKSFFPTALCKFARHHVQ
jgi:hypothetical protein